MSKKPLYNNIIEVLDVISNFDGQCEVCGDAVGDEYVQIVWRPYSNGYRFVIGVCDKCVPDSAKGVRQLVIATIGEDQAKEYELI